MDIQSSVLNELFELFPVIIPGWRVPVRPPGIADGGIPQSLYDGQSKGLECLIDPWIELQRQSWTMAVDDRVELFINDDPTPVTGATVKPGEEALRQRLYVPHGYLRHGVNRLYYKVTRVGGNTSEESRDLLVLYHLRTPDNLDLVIPPDVINDGVSADRAAQGVEFRFTYNNRRPYDRIQLLMGDTQVTFDVPDGTAAITHTVFTDTFRAAGDNPSAVIQFFVVDQLGNRSESPEKRLDIHLDRLKLEKPSIKEATNDVLEPLAARNTLTAVIQAYTDMVGTDVQVTWTGTPGEGSHSTDWIPVTAQRNLEVALRNTVVAHNLGQQVTVSYKVKRGAAESDSDGFFMTVRNISNQNPGLPTPAIDGAAGNELNVTTLADTARTRIPKWPFIALGQTLWLRYTGTKSDGNIFDHQTYDGDLIPADGLNGMQPRTPVAELAELKDGSTLRVEFKVGFGGSTDEDEAVTFPLKIYTVKALADLRPEITLATDSKGNEIPQGGQTRDTTIIIKGTATKAQRVQILDGATDKGEATVDETTGIWTHTMTQLSVADHSFTAKALYGSGKTSQARALTVVMPLSIEQGTMNLNGIKLLQSYGWPTKEVAGNVQVRAAVGGVPPLTYTSSDNTIASVTPIGKVSGMKNGQAIITVTDSTHESAQYMVQVSNVYTVVVNDARMSGPQAKAWIRSVGGEDIPTKSPIPLAIPQNFVDYDAHVLKLYLPGVGPSFMGRIYGRGYEYDDPRGVHTAIVSYDGYGVVAAADIVSVNQAPYVPTCSPIAFFKT